MKVWPLRFHPIESGLLFADDAGGWFRSDEAFLSRYAYDLLTDEDLRFLKQRGHAFEREGDLGHTAFAWRWTARLASARPLSYLMLVPTLRCNQSCDYCQVSRAAENATGYDWTDETLAQVLAFLDRLETDEIKIEFQGGEPTLRLDLLKAVRDFCRGRFTSAQFVVCTNLQDVSAAIWDFLAADDTFLSTSIDGPAAIQTRQRTKSSDATRRFFENLETAVQRLGADRISALPTIDVRDPPAFEDLVSTYEKFGIGSIYLRPTNHQGFARKQSQADSGLTAWNRYHAGFVDYIIERNARTGRSVEEFYFSLCLRRVLRAGIDQHVNIRNPNLFAADYAVIDFDGTIYPADEARMLARIGWVDLAVGHVQTGIDQEKADLLNGSSLNSFDPDCIHCAYQPFCGTDVVDDLSRYGRVDLPRHTTWFCRRHMAVFDKVFELIFRDDDATRASLARWSGIEAWPRAMAPVHA
jgi:His-Xaa-Ser system radical SAM maturase HxsB